MQSQLINAYKDATTDERKLLLVVVAIFSGFILAVAIGVALADPAGATQLSNSDGIAKDMGNSTLIAVFYTVLAMVLFLGPYLGLRRIFARSAFVIDMDLARAYIKEPSELEPEDELAVARWWAQEKAAQ